MTITKRCWSAGHVAWTAAFFYMHAGVGAREAQIGRAGIAIVALRVVLASARAVVVHATMINTVCSHAVGGVGA